MVEIIIQILQTSKETKICDIREICALINPKLLKMMGKVFLQKQFPHFFVDLSKTRMIVFGGRIFFEINEKFA